MRWLALAQVGFPLIDKLGVVLYWHGAPAASVIMFTENPLVMGTEAHRMFWLGFLVIAIPRSLLGPIVGYKTGSRTVAYFSSRRAKCFWQWRPKVIARRQQEWRQWLIIKLDKACEPLLLAIGFFAGIVPGVSYALTVVGAHGVKHKWLLKGIIGAQKVYTAVMFVEVGSSFNMMAAMQRSFLHLV